MRYLNYSCSDNSELTLNHPEDLVSLSTQYVNISNMNKCINLRNLYSYSNTYSSEDIVPLKSLRRIYSRADNYAQNGNCLHHDLFKNNKLEYVYFWNHGTD